MTIEKGQAWGAPSDGQSVDVVAADDAELARLAFEAHEQGRVLRASVMTGDLLASLGLDRPRSPDERFDYPIDLGLVTTDSTTVPFVAHVVVGRPRFESAPIGRRLGRFFSSGLNHSAVVMNCALLGPYRLGPRAHPNDGLLDIVEGRLPAGDRREAARRARTGSHLPHPALTVTRTDNWRVEYRRATSIVVDGRPTTSSSTMSVSVAPDALVLAV